MNKKDTVIILGTAHRMREPGKQSPDNRLKECIYSREICSDVAAILKSYGLNVEIDYEPLDLPKNLQSSTVKQERNNELNMRVNFVNTLCKQVGAKNVLYVSIHINGSGKDNEWHNANGWQVSVSNKASEKSKKLAACIFDAAKKNGLKMRQPSATQKYWPQNLFILNKTNCPAVLTENLFQDNRKDVDYLLSDIGRAAIVRLHVEGILKYIEVMC